MAVKAIQEITVADLTDAYNVMLSSPGYLFEGTVSAAIAGSVTVQVIATCGGSVVDCNVPNTGDNVITGMPTGVSVSISKPSGSLSPTLTISATTSFTTPGTITIPVTVVDGTNTLVYNMKFWVSINFAPDAVASVSYQEGTSSTTAPTGTWSNSPVSVAEGNYLWTKTTYESGYVAYSVAKQGVGGTSVTVSSVAYAYAVSTSGTTAPTSSSSWKTTPQAPTTTQYAWTRTTVTYSDNTTAVTYTVAGKVGVSSYTYVRYSVNSNGNPMTENPSDDSLYIGVYTGTSSTAPTAYGSYTWSRYTGQSPYSMTITTDNGDTIKNHTGNTTATVNLFEGKEKLNSVPTGMAIKWYKNGQYLTGKDGMSLLISASDVQDKAVFTAKLETTS